MNLKEKLCFVIFSIIIAFPSISQTWDGNNTTTGRASIGLNSFSSDKKLGVYNFNAGKYGIYSYTYSLNNEEVNSEKFSIYSQAYGSNTWALYAKGKVGIEGDLIRYNASNNNKWLVHLGFSSGNPSYSIIPYDNDGNFMLSRGMKLHRDGRLIKYVDNGDIAAIAVEIDGKNNFQVMGSGDVYTRSIRVTLDEFPDYVFADSYDLMPLNKLKLFIQENRHLPNIPSESEIVDKGMDVGEMQSKQMEKIEELTLYIIELNERLNYLEKENQRLNSK